MGKGDVDGIEFEYQYFRTDDGVPNEFFGTKLVHSKVLAFHVRKDW